jgi:serine/threonine protein kinase
MPPEVVEGKSYSYRTDIWGLERILLELATLQPLFENTNLSNLIRKITVLPIPSILSNYSNELNSVAQFLFTIDQDIPPTLETIQKYPLIQRLKPKDSSDVLQMKFNQLESEIQQLKSENSAQKIMFQ